MSIKVNYWNGSRWVTESNIKAWNGTAWVPTTVKAWDATFGWRENTPITNIVVIGASLTFDAFGQSLSVPNTAASLLWAGTGVNVYGYGWAGDNPSDAIVRLTSAFAAFPNADTLFVLETGGNVVTATRPYSTATGTEISDFESDIADILTLMTTRPNRCVFANITFREYANPASSSAMLLDESNGSKPYNEDSLVPLISAALPKTINVDGNPILDLYNWSRNNCKSILQADGIHMTSAGQAAMRQFYRDRLDTFVLYSAKPTAIAPLTPVQIDPSLPPDYDFVSIIGFGTDPTTPTIAWGQAESMIRDGNSVSLVHLDGSDSGWEISCVPSTTDEGVNGVWRNIGGGHPGETALYDGVDLLCDEITTSSFYAGAGHQIDYLISGLMPGGIYKIDTVGSRNAGASRFSELSFQGDTVNFNWDANVNPPTQQTGILTADSAGTIDFIQRGTTYSYLGGLRISQQVIYPGASFIATGGSITDVTIGGVDYRVHTFTSNGAFVVTSGNNYVQFLLAGGGGAGGGRGGGGGAGGVVILDGAFSVDVSPGSFPVVVGDGGTNTVTNSRGLAGGNTSFQGYTALGGGGGGGQLAQQNGGGGGSGGGGGAATGNTALGGGGTAGQGFAGTDGWSDSSTNRASGGGGGAGGAGGAAAYRTGGAGGAGIQSNFSGVLLNYSPGGGGAKFGGASGGAQGAGGAFGGVPGNNGPTGIDATTPGGGGGGSGGGTSPVVGGKGAAGIVHIRYPLGVSLNGTIGTRRVQQNTGNVAISTAGNFIGSPTSYELVGSPINGVSINSLSGIITVNTNTLARRLNTPVTVRAMNAGGAAEQVFNLSCGPRLGFAVPRNDIASWATGVRTTEFGRMRAAQAGHIRVDFDWNNIETAAATFSWVLMDDIVARATTAGMKVLGILKNSKTYAGADAQDLPLVPAEFKAFCQTCAARYPQITLWQIWNEPNGSGFSNTPDNGSVYCSRALAPGYAGVKAGNPDAVVIYGGISNKETPDGTDARTFFTASFGAGEKLSSSVQPGFAVSFGTATLSTVATPGRIRITNGAAAFSGASYTFTTIIGKAYRLRFTIHGGTANGTVSINNAASGGNLASWFGPGTYEYHWTATTTIGRIGIATNTAVNGNYTEFSGFSAWEANADEVCDRYADHPYIDVVWPGTAWTNTSGWMGTEVSRDMRAIAVARGTAKPWITTEFGGATRGTNGGSRNPMTEANQAAMLLEAWEQSCVNEPWRDMLFIYSWADRGGDVDVTENWFGVVAPLASGGAAKPALDVLTGIKIGVGGGAPGNPIVASTIFNANTVITTAGV